MTTALRCAMFDACTDDVTHIDEKGFAYCRTHGNQRKHSHRCRALTGGELRMLRDGIAIWYEPERNTAIAIQRRITTAVREASEAQPANVASIVAQIIAGPTPELAAVLAATRDPRVRDSLAQLWQCDKLEER